MDAAFENSDLALNSAMVKTRKVRVPFLAHFWPQKIIIFFKIKIKMVSHGGEIKRDLKRELS